MASGHPSRTCESCCGEFVHVLGLGREPLVACRSRQFTVFAVSHRILSCVLASLPLGDPRRCGAIAGYLPLSQIPTKWETMTNNTVVISCYFGASPTDVLEPPFGFPATFFSNNQAVLSEASTLGWEPVDVTGLFKPTIDPLQSSLQAKYVKFLKFLDDYSEFRSFDYFVYTDHKNGLTGPVVHKLVNLAKGRTSVIVRKHAEFRDNVLMEVAASMAQRRYAQNMEATLTWINDLRLRGYTYSRRVPNTGVILWKNSATAREMADRIYREISQLRQPQCQIIWTMVAQKYSHSVRYISYNSLGIRPKNHPSGFRIWLDRRLSSIREFRRRSAKKTSDFISFPGGQIVSLRQEKSQQSNRLPCVGSQCSDTSRRIPNRSL